MPERSLINESCVYAAEGEVLHPHPHPRPITQARAPIHTRCFCTSSVHTGRGRSVSREVGAAGRAAVGNIRCSLGRSNFSCREVASHCLSSGSFALDVSSGEVTEGRGGAWSSSGCPGSPAYPCTLAPSSCTRHPWVQGRGPQPPEEAAPFLGLRSPALPGFPGTREPPLQPHFSAFLFFSFELRNEAGPSPGPLAEPTPPSHEDKHPACGRIGAPAGG